MFKKQNPDIAINKKFAEKLRIAIVRTEYHKELNKNLEEACIRTLIKFGLKKKQIDTFVVPGSWEVPLVAQEVAKSRKFDAIVAFGVIIKGKTYHFEMIANECARSLMRISLNYAIPIAMEVLAVSNLKQAKERAWENDKNKGIEGALAVLKTLSTLKEVRRVSHK